MPRRKRSAGGRFVMSSPSRSTRPCRAGNRPKTVLNTVDFPAPFGPMIETT